MSAAGKYSKYIVLFFLICVLAYGLKIFVLDPGNPQNPQNKLMISCGSEKYNDYELPSNLNYSKLFSSSIGFSVMVNTSDYAKGTSIEKVVKTYHNVSSIKEWLNSIRMLNIIRNQFKWMLDSSREQIISAKLPIANISMIKTVYTVFPTTIQPNPYINYGFKLVIEDDGSDTVSLRQFEGRSEEDFV